MVTSQTHANHLLIDMGKHNRVKESMSELLAKKGKFRKINLKELVDRQYNSVYNNI